MSANLEAKKVIVEEIKNKINSAISLTFVDYRGLTVEEDTKMRKELREAGVDYKVYKNRLLLKALEELIAERDAALRHVVGTSYWHQRVLELNKEIEEVQRCQRKGKSK